MDTGTADGDHDRTVRDFANAWLRLTDAGIGERLVADPILVLGPQGTTGVPRPGFLAAVRARQAAVDATAADAATVLTGVVAAPLGERMVVATLSWSFGSVAGGRAATLVADFLLERVGDGALRCVAYLPRTNVLDHLP